MPWKNARYATASGQIGRVSAAWLPRRGPDPPGDLVSSPEAAKAWTELADAAAFPERRNPPEGFIVSANDRPPVRDVPIGWFFAPPELKAKLGLADAREGDAAFADRLLALMHASRADFTLTFRRLALVSRRDASGDGPVRDLFHDLAGIDGWLADYRSRLAA